MPQIKKEDLPPEVVEYIDALEGHVDQLQTALDADVDTGGGGDGTELAKAEQRATTAEARVEELEGILGAEAVQKDDADISKLLEKADPIVRAIFEKQDKELKANREALAKAAADQNKMQMIAKAAPLSSLNKTAEELGDVLSKAYAVSPEYGAEVETMLKAANAQVEASGIWGELGKSGNQTTNAAVEGVVAEIRKNQPNLTTEQATALAYEQNPALYDAEVRGK